MDLSGSGRSLSTESLSLVESSCTSTLFLGLTGVTGIVKGGDVSLLGVSLDVTGDLPDVAVLGSLPGTRPIDAALCEFLL